MCKDWNCVLMEMAVFGLPSHFKPSMTMRDGAACSQNMYWGQTFIP